LIAHALKEANGNRSAAAKKLGMSRRTLYRKLEAYQLEHLP
jgi:transcriptional regulator of acetoin/glycerol metabolism